MPPLPRLDRPVLAPTLDSLHDHARVLGKIRRDLTPRRRHWWHVTLHVCATGLTTTPIPMPSGSFDLTLDLLELETVLRTSRGEHGTVPFGLQSPAEHYDALHELLQRSGVSLEPAAPDLATERPGPIDPETARRYLEVLVRMDAVLEEFAGALREVTSPVQLYPHHFDLAVSWFSGRLVPGEDPDDEGAADEQLTFGFAPGDDAIPRPYLYSTAYPEPDGWGEFALPSPGRWQTEGFHAAVVDYDDLLGDDDPERVVLEFLRAAQKRGAAAMRE